VILRSNGSLGVEANPPNALRAKGAEKEEEEEEEEEEEVYNFRIRHGTHGLIVFIPTNHFKPNNNGSSVLGLYLGFVLIISVSLPSRV
jgi:hypothetical protein